MLLSESWIDRIELTIAFLSQLAIGFVTTLAMLNGQWFLVFGGTIILMLTFTPAIIERQLQVQLPAEFTLITCVFLGACFALGEAGEFYDRFWWWDLALHGISALITGLIGFLTIYVFYMTHRVQVAPIYIAIITFSFAVSIGTVWEIFEFFMDWFFGLNMQQSGLVDTMTDMIINAMGALIAAAIGYHYVQDGDSLLARKLIRTLVNKYRRKKQDC